ncbi:MAG: electron transfer flavoprotein subunit beta/FixA family protein [Deltaproteobacteria bacterium]|nr:electron transfer flavoprotein subunit beta/FixA family protein [Deltaproteobacteria bacterium]
MEAALRIKASVGGTITVVSMGRSFAMDVIKKPLAMGADELILLQDDAFDTVDSFIATNVLAAAVRKIGQFDMILCGRQASDWDNAQVPLGLAELLDLPCLPFAKNLELKNGSVLIQRVTPDGEETLEASLPAVVTVSNEFGEPRAANIKGIMAATRAKPTVWVLADLDVDLATLARAELVDLFIPEREARCEIIQGEDDAEVGRKLALKLREAKLI